MFLVLSLPLGGPSGLLTVSVQEVMDGSPFPLEKAQSSFIHEIDQAVERIWRETWRRLGWVGWAEAHIPARAPVRRTHLPTLRGPLDTLCPPRKRSYSGRSLKGGGVKAERGHAASRACVPTDEKASQGWVCMEGDSCQLGADGFGPAEAGCAWVGMPHHFAMSCGNVRTEDNAPDVGRALWVWDTLRASFHLVLHQPPWTSDPLQALTGVRARSEQTGDL